MLATFLSPCRLLVGMEVDEALAEAAAVVARGDREQARHVFRRRDGRLRRRRDRGQVRAVDDDLLNAGDVRLEFRLRPELVAEGRAVFGVGTGECELISAAGFGAAGGDAAGEGEDEAG